MFEEKRSCNGINFRYAMGRSIVSGTEIHSYNEILYYIGGDTTFLSERFSENLQAQTFNKKYYGSGFGRVYGSVGVHIFEQI